MSLLRCYDLQYKVIPFLVNQFNTVGMGSEENFKVLTDIKSLRRYLIDMGVDSCEINIDLIQITPFRYTHEINCILYTFPDPFRVPLAKYSLIVFKKTSGTKEEARYYTWELTEDFDGFSEYLKAKREHPDILIQRKLSFNWTLGEQKDGSHLNYGTRKKELSTSDDFIRDVFKQFYQLDFNEIPSGKKFGLYYFPTKLLFLSLLIPFTIGFCSPMLEPSIFGFGSIIPMFILCIWSIVTSRHLKTSSDAIFIDTRKTSLIFMGLLLLCLFISLVVLNT